MVSVGAVLSLSLPFFLISQSSFAINLCSDPWPPYIIGKINKKSDEGPIIELEKLLFSQLGVKEVNFNLINWARCLKLVECGEEDGVIMLFKKKERMRYITYTDPIITTKLLIYYSHQHFPEGLKWQGVDDLVNYNIGIVRGNSYGEAFDLAVSKGEITPYKSKDEISNLLLISKGRIDMTIINSVIADNLIDNNKMLRNISSHPLSFLEERQYIGISKKSPIIERLPEINEIIKSMHKDNTIKKLMGNIGQ